MTTKRQIICTKYANALGVPEEEARCGVWLGSWVKNPVGRFIGTAYTHYAVIWENLFGTSGRVVYYHCQGQDGKFYLIS